MGILTRAVPLAWLSALPHCVLMAQGAPVQCNPQFEKDAIGGEVGYQRRGDRCEGLHGKRVSATTVSVTSFIQVFESFDAPAVSSVRLVWGATGTPVSITARGVVGDGKYYAMETVQDGAKASYTLPVALLRNQDFHAANVGMLAKTRRRVGPVETDVYLPLRIVAGPDTNSAKTLQVSYISEVTLRRVFRTLSRVDAAGALVPVAPRTRLQRAGFSPRVQFVLELVAPETPGLYRLDLEVEDMQGQKPPVEPVYFLVGGR